VAVNGDGRRIGESHPNSKWTDAQVYVVQRLYDEGLGYTRISRITRIPRRTVRDICNGRLRCQRADRVVRVAVEAV